MIPALEQAWEEAAAADAYVGRHRAPETNRRGWPWTDIALLALTAVIMFGGLGWVLITGGAR